MKNGTYIQWMSLTVEPVHINLEESMMSNKTFLQKPFHFVLGIIWTRHISFVLIWWKNHERYTKIPGCKRQSHTVRISLIFVDDNVKSRRARTVVEYLQRNVVETLHWLSPLVQWRGTIMYILTIDLSTSQITAFDYSAIIVSTNVSKRWSRSLT